PRRHAEVDVDLTRVPRPVARTAARGCAHKQLLPGVIRHDSRELGRDVPALPDEGVREVPGVARECAVPQTHAGEINRRSAAGREYDLREIAAATHEDPQGIGSLIEGLGPDFPEEVPKH